MNEDRPQDGGKQARIPRRLRRAPETPEAQAGAELPLTRAAAYIRRAPEKAIRWPLWVRAALGILLAAVVAVAGVSVTRNYLAVQAEKRRAQEEAALKARHPLYYREQIEAAAQENNLNPALLCAVTLCESSFDPQAESRLGARGLMQLMEPTAQWVAEKLNVSPYTFDMMFDVETNLRFGAWYLGYLARRFDGDALKVVCAYHAGQGNVDAWLKNPQYSQDGVTLTTIPTDDTAKYAKRVLSAYEVYTKYYYPPADAADVGANADAGARAGAL